MQKYSFRLVEKDELKDVLSLYKNALEEEFCVWNDEYPSMVEINNDYLNNNLFVLLIDNKIIGAVSLVDENELDDYAGWAIKDNYIEMSRVVISKFYHGKNLAKLMVENIIKECKKRKYKSIHIACQVDNIPAIKTYQKVGFLFYDKVSLFNNIYYMCEYIL